VSSIVRERRNKFLEHFAHPSFFPPPGAARLEPGPGRRQIVKVGKTRYTVERPLRTFRRCCDSQRHRQKYGMTARSPNCQTGSILEVRVRQISYVYSR